MFGRLIGFLLNSYSFDLFAVSPLNGQTIWQVYVLCLTAPSVATNLRVIWKERKAKEPLEEISSVFLVFLLLRKGRSSVSVGNNVCLR